jgi:hypothetical protein
MAHCFFSLTFIFLLLYTCPLPAQDTVNISDLGYNPNSRVNAVPFVAKALELCKTKKSPVLIFPKGRYDFWPQYCAEKLYYESNTDFIPVRYCAVLIEKMNNLVVDGNGADFIFHGRLQPLTIDSCTGITVRNINIDWDVPMTAQARVVSTSRNHIDLAINVLESPYVIENNKIVFVGEGWKSSMRRGGIMEFDKETGMIPVKTGDQSCLGADYENYSAVELAYGLVRMKYNFKRLPAIGNYLILRHSARDHAGAFIINSKDVSFQHGNMFQNSGLGILSQYSENIHFSNFNFIPNKAKKRYLSGHDDGLHFSNCKGQLTVDSCRFVGLMDDPINVHGTSVRITAITNNRTLLCNFMEAQSIGLGWARVDDKVGFIENESMGNMGYGKVASFRPISPRQFEIVFKDSIPAETAIGDALENLSWTPDITISNSFFGSNRARGILATSPGKIIIHKNTFASSGAAILISGDANGWYESGAVKDVLIQDNYFDASCMTSMYEFCEAIISIYPIIPRADSSKPFHRNIRIIDNRFNPFDFPVIFAKATDSILIKGNTFTRSGRFTPFHKNKYMFTFNACKNISLSNNILRGNLLGKNILLEKTSRLNFSTDMPGQLTVVSR